MLMAVFSILTVAVAVSGIEMGPFDLFSAGTARGNLNGALHQSYDQLALVVGGSAHVRLGIGGGASGFGGGRNRLVIQVFPAECGFGLGRADRRQSDAAESYRGILTNVARHGELHGSAGTWIHGSAPLECKISAAATPRRNLHFNFGHEFVVSQRCCVGVFDEVSQVDGARALPPKAVNGGVERDQGVGPIAAWIGLSERSADGAPVSYLHVGDSGGTVVQDANLSRERGVLNLGVAGHCSE